MKTTRKGNEVSLLLKERILLLDGAMGTMIQGYKLSESDYRGERFRDHPCDLRSIRPTWRPVRIL